MESIHQQYEIALAENKEALQENPDTVALWQDGFLNYKRNEGGYTLLANVSQEVEIDANAYALCLSNMFHIMDDVELRFSVPEEAMNLAEPRSMQYYENRPELKRYIDKINRTAGQRVRKKPERNDPCLCGSGRKFKKCCIGKGIYD